MTRAESLKADLRVINREPRVQPSVRLLAELVRELIEMLEEKDLLA